MNMCVSAIARPKKVEGEATLWGRIKAIAPGFGGKA